MALRHRPCVSREPWLFRGDCGSDDGDFRAVTHAPRHLSFDSSDPHLPVLRDRLYPRSICCGGCGSRCVARVRTQSDGCTTELAPLSLCGSTQPYSSPVVWAMVVVYALLMLIARGGPALILYSRDLTARQSMVLALHSETLAAVRQRDGLALSVSQNRLD